MQLSAWFITALFAIHAVGPTMLASGIGLPASFANSAIHRPTSGRKHVGVFVAGVEGTMHHFWTSVFRSCVKMGKCKYTSELYREALWFQRNFQPALDAGWAQQDFKNHTILYLNSRCSSFFKQCTPQLSYPNGLYHEYPELVHYAQAAFSNGDQLKVIVTLRDADEILASDQERFKRTANFEIKAADVLLEQLTAFNRLFPDSWRCIDAGSIVALAQQIDTFLIDPETGEHTFDFNSTMQTWYSDQKIGTCEQNKCHNEKFQQAMYKIRELCGANFISSQTTSTEQAQRMFDFIFR